MARSRRARGLLLELDNAAALTAVTDRRVLTGWARFRGVDPAPLLRTDGVPIREKIRRHYPELPAGREEALIVVMAVRDTAGVRRLPGARQALTGDSPVAIVTSAATPVAIARLQAADLPLPDVMVTAGDVARGAPNPLVLIRAANRIGREPAECDVVAWTSAMVEAGRRQAEMRLFVVLGSGREAPGAGVRSVPDVAAYLRQARR